MISKVAMTAALAAPKVARNQAHSRITFCALLDSAALFDVRCCGLLDECCQILLGHLSSPVYVAVMVNLYQNQQRARYFASESTQNDLGKYSGRHALRIRQVLCRPC